jgi:lipopolysaccharide biosynthesis glycosyltransferase
MTLNEEIKPLKVFVGYDSREDIAYEVCRQSILQTASVPVEIIPLKLDKLRSQNWYWREEDKLGSTEFTFSRFMVPFLTDYNGWALFIDCDFVFKEDIAELFSLANDKYAVMCAHHDYTPRPGEKMDGQAQLPYPRKNWSSMVLWNCGHKSNKAVTLDLINHKDTTGAYLHRFSWLPDNLVGQVTHEWNWLVGWYKQPADGIPKALHYTEGGPWFEHMKDCEYALDWVSVRADYLDTLVKKLEKKEERRGLQKVGVEDLTLSSHAKELLEYTLQELVDPSEIVYKETKSNIQRLKEDAMGIKVAAINMPDFNKLGVKSKGLAYDPFCEDFILGSGGVLSDFYRESKTQNALVIRGLGGGGQKAIKFCRENNRDFYAIDTGYMQPVWTTRKDYHRVTKNNLQNLGPIIERPDDRLSRLGWRPSKFKRGSYILICPPSAKVMKFYGKDVDEWMSSTLEELKKHTDREIKVRLKPSRRERVTQNTIWDALQEAHCLVTFNSIAATEALLVGTPAIALAPNAASLLCNNSLDAVEDLNRPSLDEVHAFARHLSYCQFTPNELRSGYAWSIVNEGS